MDWGKCVELSFEIENRVLWGSYDLGSFEDKLHSECDGGVGRLVDQ